MGDGGNLIFEIPDSTREAIVRDSIEITLHLTSDDLLDDIEHRSGMSNARRSSVLISRNNLSSKETNARNLTNTIV
jgi:hypothetical protein